ncbi:MAG: hypothetical protein K6T61_15335, partial [Bryobacteraceae bacterium]|nr:hypothetical protein [Bryobacteraceae bacterium]
MTVYPRREHDLLEGCDKTFRVHASRATSCCFHRRQLVFDVVKLDEPRTFFAVLEVGRRRLKNTRISILNISVQLCYILQRPYSWGFQR